MLDFCRAASYYMFMTNPSLPIVPAPRASIPISPRFALSAEGDLRVIFINGQPVMEFHASDQAARDLVIVQLCEHGGLTEVEVARAFDISRPTVSRAKQKYADGGVAALISKHGPKGPSKIKDYKEQLMIEMARQGRGKVEIATQLGVNESAVRKALRRLGFEELAVRQPKLLMQEPKQESAAGEAHEAPELVRALEVVAAVQAMQAQDVQVAACEPREVQADLVAASAEGTAETPPADDALPVVTSFDVDPQNRSVDRALAHAGLLDDAAPVFGTQCNVRSAGLLLAIPILVIHGVFGDAVRIFGNIGPAFYGIRNVVASLLLMFLARINRPEHLKEHSPRELGAVLGLDRAPEMKTLRRKVRQLSALGKSLEFMRQLARRHLGRRWSTKLWLFIDGHVSVYSGKRKLKKQHVTRLRISLPAVLDYWLNDERGDPVLAVSGEPKKGMKRLVPRLVEEMRQQGEKRPVTVIFDREGWSPSMFARLAAMLGVFFLSYRKAGKGKKLPKLPAGDFTLYKGEIDGQAVEFELADRSVYLDYGPRGKRKRLHLRQLGRRKENGEQTHIVTNDFESDALLLAHRMFGRWSQENFFKYMGDEADFNGLWTYAMEDGDGEQQVPNPERKKLAAKMNKVKERLQDLTCQYGERALGNEESRRRTMRGFKIANGDLTRELCRVTEELERMKQRHDSLPATVPVRATLKGEKLKQVQGETRRLIHCFRIAVFRAESALRELLTPHYHRWRQDGRTIIQSMLHSSGNLEVAPGVLRVILAPQSAPHRSRALALLCEELNALETRFPGSDLRLNFSVQGYENVS
jgi:transposase